MTKIFSSHLPLEKIDQYLTVKLARRGGPTYLSRKHLCLSASLCECVCVFLFVCVCLCMCLPVCVCVEEECDGWVWVGRVGEVLCVHSFSSI